MAEFPASPLSPSEFFEKFLPEAFAEADVPAEVKAVDLKLGVKLEGDEGGEWLFEMIQGELTVNPGSREEASFTVVQTVEDWRGALWEGRGGAIGKQASAVFRPGEGLGQAPSAPGGMGGAPSPAALAQMEALNGLIKMVVTGAEGGDWAVGFKLGPGDVPEEPTTTVTITAEDAAAMESGALNPMEAFMAGRIQVAGDMTLMMQMQAISMQVAAQAAQQQGS
jgi:hypothetical protein